MVAVCMDVGSTKQVSFTYYLLNHSHSLTVLTVILCGLLVWSFSSFNLVESTLRIVCCTKRKKYFLFTSTVSFFFS